jgi:single-strand DNA-binding protein
MKTGMPMVAMEATLTADPEVRFTTGGKCVASLSVVCNERERGQNGQWQDGEAHFFDVTVWPKASENIAESVKQGDRVVIVGYLQQDKWETQQGEKRSKVKVVADHIGPAMTFGTAPTARERGEYQGGGGSDPWAPPAGTPEEPPF